MANKSTIISGIVRDARGKPVQQARISFTSGPVELPDVAALTGPDGTFALTAPVPGMYSIECTTDTLAPVRTTFTVERGKNSYVDIELK